MKHVAGVLAAVALLVGVTAGGVALGDRELFVSPPDAVSESFVREVMAKRWDRAREYLSEPASMPQEDLEALQEELGEGQNVEAKTIAREDSRAIVMVAVPSRHVTRKFGLTFDGEWKIEDFAD